MAAGLSVIFAGGVLWLAKDLGLGRGAGRGLRAVRGGGRGQDRRRSDGDAGGVEDAEVLRVLGA